MSPAGFDDHRRSVSLPSADLSYVDVGDGRTALFAHGIATNAHVWTDLIFELADVRRCIAIDLPLHGDSPARPEQAMTIGGFADVVAEFCEHIVGAPVDLVAHDTGGAVSQVLAARHPELLRTLTLTNCETQDNVTPAAMAATVELARTGQLASVAPAILADPAASRALYTPGYQDPSFLSDEQVRCFLEPVIGTPGSAQRFQELIAALGPAELLASEPALRGLDVPTLILWGPEDRFFALKWAYWLQGTIPSAREVIEVADAKLFFPHERAAEIAPHIRRHWLQSDDPGRSEEGDRERDLLDGLSDALDEYDAGGTDLPSLVRDTDSVIVELSGRSEPRRLAQLRRQWRRLAETLAEVGATGMQPLSEPQLDRVSDAVDGLRGALTEVALTGSPRFRLRAGHQTQRGLAFDAQAGARTDHLIGVSPAGYPGLSMEQSPDHDDRDEAVEEAAEHAERAGQEREEMKRKAALAEDADKSGDSDELERESEAHRQAAYEREDAASDRAHEPE